MTRAIAAAVVLSGCLAVVGCTSSKVSDTTVRDTLASVILQLSDFPPSWRQYPPPASQPDVLDDLAACTGDPRTGKRVAEARSGEFRNGRQQIASLAVAYDSQDAVSMRAESLANPKANSCMAQVMRRTVLAAAPADSTVTSRYTVTAGGVNVAADLVGTAVGIVTVTVDGNPVKVYVDVTIIAGRNFYADITFVGVGRRVSDLVRSALVNDVAKRAQHT
jgi:hypothetical protein